MLNFKEKSMYRVIILLLVCIIGNISLFVYTSKVLYSSVYKIGIYLNTILLVFMFYELILITKDIYFNKIDYK